MKKIFVILIMLVSIFSCTPQLLPADPDIDKRPGKPLYQSYLPKYDTLYISGTVIFIENEPYSF